MLKCLWGVLCDGVCVLCQGSDGVEQVLQILRDEFRVAMMLSGERMVRLKYMIAGHSVTNSRCRLRQDL